MKPERHYKVPPATDREPAELVAGAGAPGEESYVFYDKIELGRYREAEEGSPGVLLINDPTVSSRHCSVAQTHDGRFFVRDMSLNGTFLAERRLVANLDVEVLPGQVIRVTNRHSFVIRNRAAPAGGRAGAGYRSKTVPFTRPELVTVLVGDIWNYTVMVQSAASGQLQESIEGVFQRLSARIEDLGGTVKEYQGDAILAFWERKAGRNQAADACAAARDLDGLVASLAADRGLWPFPDMRLRMDWALATGPVSLRPTRDGGRACLSLVGEPVVLAFRIEKFANEETGPIVACRATMEQASGAFEFKDLGEVRAKGFDRPERIFALRVPGRRPPAA